MTESAGAGAARRFTTLGALSALIAVAAGAFGAHGLESRLTSEALRSFEVAVRYQFYHALALLFVAWAVTHHSPKLAGAAGLCFAFGTLLFSGSLYALALTDVRALGAVTPFGGLLFLSGWALVAWSAWRS
ncbi:MAG TPA: DUF423 domain-containing protein [Polyangiaceae bacterium]